MRDGLVGSADHQAVAALEAEHPAAGADVDVVEPELGELLPAADIVVVVGVAAVDDDVARLEQRGDLIDDLAGDAGRDHHPDDAGRGQLADEVLHRLRPGRALAGQRRHRLGIDVEDHALVSVAHQAPDDVGAHPAEADHSQLHLETLVSRRQNPQHTSDRPHPGEHGSTDGAQSMPPTRARSTRGRASVREGDWSSSRDHASTTPRSPTGGRPRNWSCEHGSGMRINRARPGASPQAETQVGSRMSMITWR